MKKLILIPAVFALSVLVVLCSIYLKPAYRNFKISRGLKHAREFLRQGDLPNASVSARQVLQSDSRNIEACRIMAELAEQSHSPAVIDWRRRIVDMAATVSNRLKLAVSELRYERPPYRLAEQTLAGLEKEAGNIAAFHLMSAELALRLGQIEQATAQFEQASLLEPSNQLHQLNLAVLHLQSTNADVASTARITLGELSNNGLLRRLALRWLVADNLRRNDLASAKRLSERLLADPNPQLDDRLQHLSILKELMKTTGLIGGTPSRPKVTANAGSGPSEFGNYLGVLQKQTSTNGAGIYSICEWMGRHGLAGEGLRWLEQLEPNTRHHQPVVLAEANLYLARADWARLEEFLRDGKWEDLEFLRLAMLAHAAWGQNCYRTGEARWAEAQRAAGTRVGSLTLLLSLAAEWGRDQKALLWEIGRRFPKEEWALRELERRYAAVGDTRSLNRVYGIWDGLRTGAANWANRNNFAATSMLLGINLPQAHKTAGEVYRHNPEDALFTSTYAYSLHLQGRTRDGLQILEGLKQAELESPLLALYYGVLLSEVGERSRASRYLAIAETARLLPEEKQLLARAKAADRPDSNAKVQRR
jgi:Tfp pilus assembly protein PilF